MTETRSSTLVIQEFMNRDTEKLAELIQKYPQQIPVPALSDFLGCSEDTLRSALENGFLGISERKPGRCNRGFVVPTGHFMRWYMCAWHF